MIIEDIKLSLNNMDKEFVSLSRLKINELSDKLFIKIIQKQKIQERPFAYEFYHQWRKLWDSGNMAGIVGEDIVIQGEVNKRYQEIPNIKSKIPDFLLHKPTSNENVAVIEFKLATNLYKIKNDFDKFVKFKEWLNYNLLIEIVIGDSNSLRIAKTMIQKLRNDSGTEIKIVEFNTEAWESDDFTIKY